ncbi:TIR-NBS-LRR resistance protein, partial [Trifolium medium]|nr:TIR-NBS-LRR resistance protein [Trifolium medium]
MITELHLTRVIIELDAAKIVSAVKKKVFPRNQWGKLTQRCARALDDESTISISWVRREGNEAAHVLARWVVSEPN